jgi:hypothetical protein
MEGFLGPGQAVPRAEGRYVNSATAKGCIGETGKYRLGWEDFHHMGR